MYVLGDFSFKRAYMVEYLPYLNGRKFLVAGNHDPFFKSLVSSEPARQARAMESAREDGWGDVCMRHQIEIQGIGQVMLSHFPYQQQKDLSELLPYEARYHDLQPVCDGTVDLLLHEHVHGKWKTKRETRESRTGERKNHLMINVGVDVWSMRPVSEQELVELFDQNI